MAPEVAALYESTPSHTKMADMHPVHQDIETVLGTILVMHTLRAKAVELAEKDTMKHEVFRLRVFEFRNQYHAHGWAAQNLQFMMDDMDLEITTAL